MSDTCMTPVSTSPQEGESPIAVRPDVRLAWESLRELGQRPSVRRMRQLVGGSQQRLVEELRQLRSERGDPLLEDAEDEDLPVDAPAPLPPAAVDDREPPALGTAEAPLDVPAATVAVAVAEAALQAA